MFAVSSEIRTHQAKLRTAKKSKESVGLLLREFDWAREANHPVNLIYQESLERQYEGYLDECLDAEGGILRAPPTSRHDVIEKLKVVRDRECVGLETSYLIKRLESQMREWLRREPCSGLSCQDAAGPAAMLAPRHSEIRLGV